jgi:citronellol/citronellal dehydrogenase
VAKTSDPHPKLPGTVFTACEAIEKAGGKALPCVTDIRFEDQVVAAVKQTVQAFGGIDALVNNASAIHLTPTPATPMKRFDLMHQVNTRGTFLCSQACHPHLARAANPHILNISPPLSLAPRWFAPHVAYTIAKYGMSLCVLGMAGEFKSAGIAVNALWPRTIIATAAVQNLLGGDEAIRRARKPDIMGDAAHAILTKPSREFTGRFLIDEDLLREEGVSDFSGYLMVPGAEPLPDFFLPESGD